MTSERAMGGSPAELTAAVVERADDVATVLAEMAGLLTQEDVGAALEHVLVLAKRTVPDCDAAGITLLDRGRAHTAAHTDQRTLEIDGAQYRVGQGPCLEAARTRTMQRVVVEEAVARWPDFAAAAAAAGVKSFLAAPLLIGDESIGALNLYSDAAHGFDPLDEAFVALFTGQVAAAVASVRRYDRCRHLTENLTIALETRGVIEQAKGILMASWRLTPDEAFDWLRERSQHRNLKLRRVAEELVADCLAANGRQPDGAR